MKIVLKTLAIDTICKGKYQPRLYMNPEALQQLADSIQAQGIVQPIVVRLLNNTAVIQYELIAGERRWRAAQLAGLTEIPAIIRKVSDQAVAAMSLIENIQREELNPLEEAHALQRLIDEFSLTHQQIAQAVGRSRSAVSNLLRLLNLGSRATNLLMQGHLEMGHARAILKLNPEQQAMVAKKVFKQALSVRQTERWVKRLLSPNSANKSTMISPEITQLEQQLSEKLGAKVCLNYHSTGKGKLIIEYYSLDELEGILEKIQ